MDRQQDGSDAPGAVEPGEEGAGEIGLGVGQLLGGGALGPHLRPFGADQLDRFGDTVITRRHPAHDQPGVVESGKIAVDRISEAALLADLFGEPGGKAAAAEDAVHHVGGVIIGIVPLDPAMTEEHHALGDVLLDHEHLADGGGRDLGQGVGLGPRRQSAEGQIEKRRQFLGRDIADDADHQIVAPQAARDEILEVPGGDPPDALGRALGGAAVGMVGKRRPVPGPRSDAPGPLGRARQVGEKLGADSFHRFGIEARAGQGQAQEIEGGGAVDRKGAQRAAEIIEPGTEAEADGKILEPPLEGL